MRKFLFFIIFIALLIPNTAQSIVKKGDLAPDFTIIDTEGKSYRISQFKEKVILIEFLSVKCFACDYVIPDMNRLFEKYNGKNVKIIGVLFTDEVENTLKLKKFAEEKQIKYPLYTSDSKNKKLYNLYGFPNFFILNEKKIIVQLFRGITKDTFGLLDREIKKIFEGKN